VAFAILGRDPGHQPYVEEAAMEDLKEIEQLFIMLSQIPIDGIMVAPGFSYEAVVNDVFLSSIAVYKRLDGSGYRILYPTKRIGVCDMTICHPTTAELSREVEKAICTKAEEVLGL
jgi:stage V sporulation protein G